MSYITLLTEQFINDKISGRANQKGRAFDIANSISTTAVILAVIAAGFFILATYSWLEKQYQTDMAAAITGFVTLFMAFLASMLLLAIMHYKQRSVKKLRYEIKESLESVFESIDEIVGEPIKDNPKISAIIALIIGFVIGEKTF